MYKAVSYVLNIILNAMLIKMMLQCYIYEKYPGKGVFLQILKVILVVDVFK